MPNKRIYYAVHAVAFAPIGVAASSFNATHVAHGVQSVGVTVSFNLEQIFELGQLSIYENIENIPNIEMTVEKVLDGYPPVYCLATRGASSVTLGGRSNVKTIGALAIFDDTQDAASGTPISLSLMSGLFINNISYNFPVDGSFTESVSLVGNNKSFSASAPSSFSAMGTAFVNGGDVPKAIYGSGGVNRREDLLLPQYSDLGVLVADVNGQVNTNLWTILPPDIDGIDASGVNVKIGDDYTAHLQSISVSTSLGRTELFELGRRGPYHRFANFPTEVTCEISTIGVRGDNITATEAGTLGDGNNLTNRTIKLVCREGLYINLGTKNKLASVSYTGGNAGTGGGNVIVTYNYSNFNDLSVYHPADPSAFARP